MFVQSKLVTNVSKVSSSSRRLSLIRNHLSTSHLLNFSILKQNFVLMSSTSFDFDYFVIGVGSGGIASARRAASYGAKVAVAEKGPFGGTCVNVGCVPKKVMWYTAQHAEFLHDHQDYGFDINPSAPFSWSTVKTKRDEYIKRLNDIYRTNLEKDGIKIYVNRHNFFLILKVFTYFIAWICQNCG